MPKPTTIAELRSLVAAWTPPPVSRGGAVVATGVEEIDSALGGGLPSGRVTELVSEGPSVGSDLVLAALLASTRSARQRVALVDAADCFVPGNYRADLLQHLVWVRANSLPQALQCADVLVRDGNYATLVIDLRGIPARAARQQPSSVWHRLRLAAESNPCAVVVLSTGNLIPAVPWRILLRISATLSDLRRTRAERAASLKIEIARSLPATGEQLAG